MLCTTTLTYCAKLMLKIKDSNLVVVGKLRDIEKAIRVEDFFSLAEGADATE